MELAQASGALLGLAVGDAMGAPLEGLPPPRRRVTEMEGGGLNTVRPGQYTDDTLQTCALARSLIVCRGYSAEDVLLRLAAGYRRQPRFYGPTARAAFALVGQGYGPEDAARIVHSRNRGSRSNGSVMRGLPLGIFYRPHRVGEVSRACSRLTHFDPVAGECSAFVNRMASELCRGRTTRAAYHHALTECRDREVFAVLSAYDEFELRPTLDAVQSTHCALAVFMNAPSYEEAVLAAINLGGDADTVGAITGGLAGAAWGIAAIPRRWLLALQDAEKLHLLSRQLWAVSQW